MALERSKELIKNENFTRSNREKSNNAITILGIVNIIALKLFYILGEPIIFSSTV